MRVLVCICIAAGCLAAQDSAKTSPPPAAKAAKKAPADNGIPKDAVATSPGFYRWTDKTGKVWTLRKTPFGVSRWPADSENEGQGAAVKQSAASERTIAVEQGDSIRFEQVTPFGKHTWVRKKSDLNESEQRIWDLQRKNSTASRTAEKE